MLQEEHKAQSFNDCKSDLNGKNPFTACLSSPADIWKNTDYYLVIFNSNLEVINQQGSCVNPRGPAQAEDLDIELLNTTLVEIKIQFGFITDAIFIMNFSFSIKLIHRPRIVIFL